MSPNSIGTLQETTLHAELKQWYARPGDKLEVPLEGYFIDLVRGDLLVEFQTRHFHAIRTKLERLLENHPVRLVYPIAREKWIIHQDASGQPLPGRRKSPRTGRVEHLFAELVRIPSLIQHINFSLEVLLIQEEEIRRDDGRGSWRRKGVSIYDKRLLAVLDLRLFNRVADYLTLLPAGLDPEFTVRQLATAAHLPPRLAGKMAYSLRHMGLLEQAGRKGRAYQYRLALKSG